MAEVTSTVAVARSANDALEQGRYLLRQRHKRSGGEAHIPPPPPPLLLAKDGRTRSQEGSLSSPQTSLHKTPTGFEGRHAQALRHLRELDALDKENTAVFSRRIATLQRFVADANEEARSKGQGGVSSRLARKEEELAELTYVAQALEEGEVALTELLNRANSRLLGEGIPHVRKLLAETLECSLDQLPAFPPPARSTSDLSFVADSPLSTAVGALSSTAVDLERYLSFDVAPLLQRFRANCEREIERVKSALAEAKTVRDGWRETLAGLIQEGGRGEGEGTAPSEAALEQLRKTFEAMQEESAWVMRGLPLLQRKRALLKRLADADAAEQDALASLAREQQAAEALIEQVATAECDLERARAANQALSHTTALQLQEAEVAAQQAAAIKEEFESLRHALHDRQRSIEAAEVERLSAEQLLSQARLLSAQSLEEDRSQRQAALAAVREEQRARETHLRRLREDLRQTQAQSSLVLKEVDFLKKKKHWLEEELVSDVG